jgi:hypothetical protein
MSGIGYVRAGLEKPALRFLTLIHDDAVKPPRTSGHEFKIFVISNRRVDKQSSKMFWLGDHHAAPVRFDKPVAWVVRGVMNGFDLGRLTMKAHSVPEIYLLTGLVEEWHSAH